MECSLHNFYGMPLAFWEKIAHIKEEYVFIFANQMRYTNVVSYHYEINKILKFKYYYLTDVFEND